MEENPLTIQEQEKYALDNYTSQHTKMSNLFIKQMNKRSIKETLLNAAVSALGMGLVIGAIHGQTNAYVPVHSTQGRVIEYKYVSKIMAKSILDMIAVALLVSLVISSIKITIDAKRNSKKAKKLANDTLGKFFIASIDATGNNVSPLHIKRAAALILNNMQPSKLEQLRTLALSGLVCDENGHYSIKPENIAAASQIISTFINQHMEIGFNVYRIIKRGQQPITYFFPRLMEQKTR